MVGESKPKAADILCLEIDSCYRGRVEIWRDRNGKIVNVDIIR